MKDKTLVILAAGMGSRFGGPKQFCPVGPNGEFIMDYSIYSAKKYGFTKIVFVIRKEHLDTFNDTIGKRLKGKIDFSYVFQSLDILPEGIKVPDEREKPWGTAHALYCSKDEVKGNLAVITADDFYGDIVFKQLSYALDTDNYSVIGYKIADTMSLNGTVKRGVSIVENGLVKNIIESVCSKDGDKVKCEPLNKDIPVFEVEKDSSVSMLMYGFTQDIFKTIDDEMENSFKNNKDNLLNFEFLLPDIIAKEIKNGRKVLDIPTESKWVGVTYKEDVDALKEYIESLIDSGIYPKDLW